MRSALLHVLGLLASAGALHAQVISGTLVEAASRSPLPGAMVTLLDPDSAAVARLETDGAGAFSFILPHDGAYRLHAERQGYRAVTTSVLTVGPLDTLHVELSLSQHAVMLEPVQVTVRTRRLTVGARGFHERAASRAFGTFITRQEIEKARPLRMTDLFRRIPGVWITPTMDGNQVTIRGSCRPSVYVDGVRVNEYRSIDALAQPLDLEGVEVYANPQHAPPQFTGIRTGCAVVLLWTRIT